ncbi:MAG TPA: adenylate/guanylate cyclase domain-containing protein [Gaiellaceae bacterium]|nr:adenylate/guanylate cyclase domain-containing protein [Gaiellaceae bacterium]
MATCANCGHENPDGSGFCNACGSPVGAAAADHREQRKTVTVLFADMTGSTALGERLDPESLRHVLGRYFDLARATVERHGGAVEKFIGDAVMAVFGVPRVHEDDALRAVRAAADLRHGLGALNETLERDFATRLELRIGVNTGEVVTGTAERLATGDAVNVAARLEQAAQPGEILLGADTLRLVRDAVSVEPVAPLELKGKSERIAAHRLLAVDAHAPAHVRRLDVPMVGRHRQLRLLADAFDQVVNERSCHLFTVLGPAGVGKSRLVGEFLQTLGDVTVLAGRCLSYGEGITYWPAVEIVKQAGGAEAADDATVRTTLDALLGDSHVAATPAQIAWAFRKLVEVKAAERPVVCLVDDLQWGEPTFLELVEHVADLSRDAPILLVCMARPELLDRHSTWAGGKLNATSVLLEPLSETETDELIGGLLAGSTISAGLQARIRRAAGGNPLFVEEMLALVGLTDDGGEVAVPPTIQALLAARLDQLALPERSVLERASVEGEVFHRGGVAALGDEEPQLDTRLTALVRKDLLRPERPQLLGEDGYRFRHLLVRDATYGALPKAIRAGLHERFAAWLHERAGDVVEHDELVGYHLEQAFRYRQELGPVGDADHEVARRAGELLVRAGRRAFDRGDRRAAATLLERARRLLSASPLRVRTLIDLGRCLAEALDDVDGGRRALDEAIEEAVVVGRDELGLWAQLERFYVGVLIEAEPQLEAMEALSREATRMLERAGDDEGVARAWFLFAMPLWAQGRWDDMMEPLERSIEYARRAGRRSMELEALRFVLAATMFGSTTVDAGIERGRRVLDEVTDSRELRAWGTRTVATMMGLDGRADEARALFADARAIFAELDNKQGLAVLAFSTAPLELMAGDLAAAERELRAALDLTYEMGDRSRVPNLSALLADVLLDQDRVAEAERYLDIARDAVQAGDAGGQTVTLLAEARLLSRRGSTAEAAALADEAIAILRATQELITAPSSLRHQAEVLLAAGRDADAAAALREAIAAAERKGASAEANLTRARLDELAAR